jgi:2-octaprenyl-6-methoxyphenol hydroxylase
LIVGGGMVGASLACALAELPLSVGLVESIPFGAAGQPSYDDRTTALALGTRRIYEALGLWDRLAPSAEPIRQIHVSEQGRFGTSRMDASEQGADALGYVVENRVLGEVLSERMSGLPRLHMLCPAQFMSLQTQAEQVSVRVRAGAAEQTLNASLVVGADGASSRVREALGIGIERRDYAQTAIVTNVTPERDHAGMAYERFTPTGPIALLPMSQQRCALVWTQPQSSAESVLQLADADFLSALNQAFGHRLGEFLRVGKRASYPLQRVLSERLHAPRVLLIGNAAHSLHPVAGQGFNLGLRDVAVLAEVLADSDCRDCGSDAVIQAYIEGRQFDQAHVTQFTDGLVRLFSNRLPGLASFRHLGIVGLDLLPPLKARFTQRSMGMVGAPRLSRGLPLVDAGSSVKNKMSSPSTGEG